MTQRLSELLDEATRALPVPDLAATAWARGRARRRHARLLAGGASALTLSLIVWSAIVLSDRHNDPPPQTALPPVVSTRPLTTSSSAESRSGSAQPRSDDLVLVAPSADEETTVPFAESELPASVSIRSPAAPLSEDHVARALALMQTVRWSGDSIAGFDIFVLGVDQRVRRLDVKLAMTRDEAGNGGQPLSSKSLRADGLRAVFAQPEEVVVVDLTTGIARRYPVPGLNEGVEWLPDGNRVVIGRTKTSVVLDIRTGAVSAEVPPMGLDDAANPGQLRRLNGPSFDNGGRATGPAQLVTLDRQTGKQLGSPVAVDQRVDRLTGGVYAVPDGIAFGAVLNLAGRTPPGLAQNPSGVAVINPKTGELARALAFGMDRNKGIGALLGRTGAGGVLYQSNVGEKSRLMSWNPDTGAVTRLTEFAQSVELSLAELVG